MNSSSIIEGNDGYLSGLRIAKSVPPEVAVADDEVKPGEPPAPEEDGESDPEAEKPTGAGDHPEGPDFASEPW